MAETTRPPAVALERVRRDFPGVAALDDITLTIGEGEFFSLLGPSGCGKSTTLRIIGGFEQPTAGEVRIRGELMGDVPPNRRPTNMVFQHLGLFPHLNVFENVAFGLRLKRRPGQEIAQRVAAKLEMVGLGGLDKRFPSELSGGQQQRVAIARALVNEPSVLLLDEPLGALDLRLRQKMQTELKGIQRQLGTTFVYVTHDQSEAFTMSDRIGIMNAGRLEQVATPEEIYTRPASAFVADFVGETNLLPGKVAALSGESAVIEAEGGLRLSVPKANLAAGAPVTLSIRPEQILLTAGTNPDGVPVTVRTVVFQGPYRHVTVETAGGASLMVRVAEAAGASAFTPGVPATAQWEADAVRVLG